MLLHTLKLRALSVDYLIDLLTDVVNEKLEVGFVLVLIFIGNSGQLVDVHLFVIDCHFQLLDHFFLLSVLVFMLLQCLLQLLY